MKILRVVKISVRQLFINRSGSFFAIAGLSVGVASVITMAAIGNGAKKETLDQLAQMGTNLITVNAGKIKSVAERRGTGDVMTTLRLKDSELIRKTCTTVREVVPSISGMIRVKYGSTSTMCMVNGVSAPYFRIKNFKLKHGDLFTDSEDRKGERVAVLGGQISETLFGEEDPTGTIVRIGNVPFRVIGVLESKGTTSTGSNLDIQILIPVHTAMRRIFNVDYLNLIIVEVIDRSELQNAEEEIITVLRNSHRLNIRNKENDFTIDNQLNDIQASESASRSFTWLIAGVSAVALLVGGIGILAVMLLSVKERYPEIGLRMAVGATRKDIVVQFIMESVILGMAGGVLGFLIGFVVSVSGKYMLNWNVAVSPSPVFISLTVSLFTGLVFGIIPARNASQAEPVYALQSE